MTNAPYDSIAAWYDQDAVTSPFYQEMVVPSIMALVGDVEGEVVCDIACGQGVISRELARRGAQVIGIDISTELLNLARGYEAREPLGIRYVEDDAQSLSHLSDGSVDGVTCCMALMNIPDLVACVATISRVLKRDGWFVATITHPCFQTPHSEWIITPDNHPARLVRGYVPECFWRSDNPDGVRGRVGEHHRTLSTYLNTTASAGFVLEQMHEPLATGQRATLVPGNQYIPSILTMRMWRRGAKRPG